MTEASNYFLANCKFSFKCTKNWENLNSTSEQEIRYCSDCHEKVYYCKTKSEIIWAIKNKKCISIYSDDNYMDLMSIGQIIHR